MSKKTIFSGIQPTGQIHLGNYFGAIKNWVKLQDEYNCIYSIVDYHAITVEQDPEELKQNKLNLAAMLLACGIDPKKSILFVQSDVPAHTELAWIFNTLTPISELERMTQFKDKSEQNKSNINAGLFTYPILQSADILLYKADAVPVGEDQLQHIELTRMIARKFNNRYGDFFQEPNYILNDAAFTSKIYSLTDPTKKMSKSHGEKSYIALTDSPEIIRQKIAKAVTDTYPNSTTTSPGVHNLMSILKSSTQDKKLIDKIWEEQHNGTLKYSELKEILAEQIISTLEPIQEKYNQLIAKPAKIKKILESGAKQAEKIANKNISEIKNIVGL